MKVLDASQKRPLSRTFQADARTRTGDPFITRERRVRDARPRAGTRGHVLAGVRPFERVGGGTRVPARARADVPVLYPVEADVWAGCRAHRAMSQPQEVRAARLR